jgi:hypothetical protein
VHGPGSPDRDLFERFRVHHAQITRRGGWDRSGRADSVPHQAGNHMGVVQEVAVMARPVERGRDGSWSRAQIAAEAGVALGVARAAVARGFLPDSGYTAADIVLLRVAAACLATPDPSEPLPPKHSPAAARPGRRDADALRFARAILGDPRADPGAVVLLGGHQVVAVDRAEDLAAALARLYPAPVTVLPVGWWVARLPVVRTGLWWNTASPSAPGEQDQQDQQVQANPGAARPRSTGRSRRPAPRRGRGEPVAVGAAVAELAATLTPAPGPVGQQGDLLGGADLPGADLPGADLPGADLPSRSGDGEPW